MQANALLQMVKIFTSCLAGPESLHNFTNTSPVQMVSKRYADKKMLLLVPSTAGHSFLDCNFVQTGKMIAGILLGLKILMSA